MKSYLNSTKDERTLEIVVSGREMHPIRHESKFVILFNHPPHGDVEEAFECWAIQCFVQVTTEGRQEDFFDQEVPAGVQAQEPQQPNTGNKNAANNNNNNDHEPTRGATTNCERNNCCWCARTPCCDGV